ncbi:FAD dependent oxidoreductase-domain-containing protein [Cladorrhinum samala]|uniref:FAD dependent oxidoreductase-domain-containing protein n=1 Tax=Cladorrhinum samala TaxID=585594 RepID=A0AAV9HEQ6_9PEZI|nr:FAD dependent oxidoreductase-domain-containing protein [Cladorrhinum samala]
MTFEQVNETTEGRVGGGGGGGDGGRKATAATASTAAASLPSENPTRSYWLRDPSKILLGHRSTEDLPGEADVVIVGSGITGAFAARTLFEEWDGGEDDDDDEKEEEEEEKDEGGGRKARVVMLEAREACSGATGRNGGHCQPLIYGAVPEVAKFELENFEFLKNLVEQEKIDCDWTTLPGGVHAFYSENMFSLAVSSITHLQETHPSLGSILRVVTDRESLAELRVPTALGAVVQSKAASLWPYKLVAHVLESLLSSKRGLFNLQTSTPVTSISPSSSTSGQWTVSTPRGEIKTSKILVATNGYASNLLPSFSDLIVPVRGQVSALLPPFPSVELSRSYVFASDPVPDSDPDSKTSSPSPSPAPRDDYLVQRPQPGGEIIFGGGRRFASGLGVSQSSDSELEPAVAEYLRSELYHSVLDLTRKPLDPPHPPPPAGAVTTTQEEQQQQQQQQPQEHQPLKASHEWTGIMGYSRDLHPWVGPVPASLLGGGGSSSSSSSSSSSVFLCAGYTGHGMPCAALSGRHVARQMLLSGIKTKKVKEEKSLEEQQQQQQQQQLPNEFRITEERVKRAREELPPVEGGWEVNTFGTLFSGVLSGEEKGEE